MRANDDPTLDRVPKLPRLHPIPISNEDTLASVRSERLPLLLPNEHIGEATKDAEVGNVGFLVLPSGVRNATIESRGRRAIGDMDIGGDGEIPERRRELSFDKHRCSSESHVEIRLLCYAVLVGFIRLGMLAKNPFLCTIRIPILPNILSSLIVPQHLNLPP